MITLQDIRGLEFSSMEDFFAYVEESYVNGNKKAALGYIDKMSKNQKRLFVRFLSECPLTIRALYDHTLNKL